MEKESYLFDRYKNKICLVTGSSLGIGYAIIEKFGLEGGTVIVSSRKQENVKKAVETLTVKGIKAEGMICNYNNKEDRKKVYSQIKEKYNKLDVLVCNVGVSPYVGNSYEINEKEFDKIFETNVKNTFFTIKEFLPLIKNAKDSSILIVSSQGGYTPFSLIGIYSISKTVLLSMTKLLAEELAKFKIRINCIAPGITNTRFAQAIINSDEAKNNFMKRYAMPNEIASAAGFLCSKEASFITGETLCINGGMHGRL